MKLISKPLLSNILAVHKLICFKICGLGNIIWLQILLHGHRVPARHYVRRQSHVGLRADAENEADQCLRQTYTPEKSTSRPHYQSLPLKERFYAERQIDSGPYDVIMHSPVFWGGRWYEKCTSSCQPGMECIDNSDVEIWLMEVRNICTTFCFGVFLV